MQHHTFDTVSAGLHCSLRMSRQMLPLLLMLGWYTFVEKLTCARHENKGSAVNFAALARLYIE